MAWNKNLIKKIIPNRILISSANYKKIALVSGVGILLLVFSLYAFKDNHYQDLPTTKAIATIVANAQQNALEQFNQTVQIIPLSYYLYKDKTEKEMIAFKYHIVNKSTETISQLKWYTVISLDKQLLDIFAIPASLTLPAKEQVNIIYHIPLTHFPENLQKNLLANKSLKLNLTTVAGDVVLHNDRKITVTTDQMLKEELNGFFHQVNGQ